ncbi:hypothetical protein [Streptomyces sp. NRRL B-24484]|uniref:hypothetical protein n=1 Tax=Streptomyces sp. NRRL B-24484 TaxID=1463833 RepID=UPI001901CF83|nr:hypothetical protein [Streptomyces sp. NRRL B-24484]
MVERSRTGEDGAGAQEWPAAVFLWAVVVALDGWLLTFVWSSYRRAVRSGWDAVSVHGAEKSALIGTVLLCGPVLLGALVGGLAGRRPTTARRWRAAAVGALAAHLLLLALLVVGVLVHPPRFVF